MWVAAASTLAGVVITALVALLNHRRSTSGSIKQTPAEKLWDVIWDHYKEVTDLVSILQQQLVQVNKTLDDTSKRLRITEKQLRQVQSHLATTEAELASLKQRMTDG